MKKYLQIIFSMSLIVVCSDAFGVLIRKETNLSPAKEIQNNTTQEISNEKLQSFLDENGKPLLDPKDIHRDSLETDVMNERFLNGVTAGDNFGFSVSGAGDVNGDGYDDIIVGANTNDAGGSDAGRAYIYFGGSIFNSSPDIIFTGEAAGVQLGYTVSSAGDVNGDSYSDVIIGAPLYNGAMGRAYMFFGGQNMNNVADVTFQGEAANHAFGISVSSAGNVNGDGFSDIVIGAPGYNSNAGRVYIYYGGSIMNNVADVILSGAAVNNVFGNSVSEAGDVNGDGFQDVIVGAYGHNTNTGRTYIYFGGAAMNNVADVVMTGEGTDNRFGVTVSTAGDVNGDGYSDIITGADGHNSDRGRAYIYFGGAVMNNVSDLQMSGEGTAFLFGKEVSNAGDLNCDGYSDVIVGSIGVSQGAGRAYIFKGGPAMDSIRDKLLNGEAFADFFATALSSAGDVNGDGMSDLVIGAPSNNTNGADAGRAYLYMTSMTGEDVHDLFFDPETPPAYYGYGLTSAGDVNGDGYTDVMISSYIINSSTGRVYIYFGGPLMDNTADVTMNGQVTNSYFGINMASAGDVNADGFSDVIVGALLYSGNTGRAYIFFGGASMNNVADVIMTGEAAATNFGVAVSSAGDVNNDGFSDVIVGANGYSSGTGRAYVFLGGASMNNVADAIMTGAAINNSFGSAVCNAGDLNGDGFSDLAVGAFGYSTSTGRAYIYYGNTIMDNNPDVLLTGEGTGHTFGISVSSGDINGDEFSDLMVGAQSAGRAYVYYGGLLMNNVADVTMLGEASSFFGNTVAGGDINDDGYSDVIVGAEQHNSYRGKVFIFFGSVSMDNLADVTMTGETDTSQFGSSLSVVDDFNGDGQTDLLVGAYRYNNYAGRAYLFMSSSPQVNQRIISVKDVPFDQGGLVNLRWARNGYDVQGQNIITGYLIERSSPPGITGYFWQTVTTVPSLYNTQYEYTSATPNDSMNGNNGVYFYRITAQTSEPTQFWRSNIMSGYSIDNLSPSAPLNLAATPDNNSIYLTWGQNQESDLHYYNVYRDGIVIGTSSSNSFDDITVLDDSTYDYRVTAVDIHGNISPFSNLVSVSFNNSGILNVTVVIEGFYNAPTNNMNISDTLRVRLRSIVSPFAIVDSAKAVINSVSLLGSFLIRNVATGSYYVQTKHRNTIETWSAAGINYTLGGAVAYNFTTSSSQAYGSNMKQVDTSPIRFGIYSGDANQDGIVDVSDLVSVYNNAINFTSGYLPTDMNGDNFTDVSDVVITYNNSINFVGVIRP